MSVLGLRDFRLLVISNVATFTGFQIRTMAQAWLVLERTDSSLWVGIVNAMPGVAVIAISLFGGAIADRSDRRMIMLRTKLVISVLAFLTAFLVTSGVFQPWHLIPIGLMTGSMFAFHNPATQTFVMDVVGGKRLLPAISINATISNAANIVGPAVGGILLALGIDTAFYLLGTLYFVSFAALLMVRGRGRPARVEERNLLADIKSGVGYSLRTPVIRGLLSVALTPLFIGTFLASVPLFARNILEVGELGYGSLISAHGAGALITSVVLVIYGYRLPKGRLITGALMAVVPSAALFAISSEFWLSLVAMFGVGVGFAMWGVSLPTALQMYSAPEMRGRVMSVFFMTVLMFQLGWLVGGALDTAIGTRQMALAATAALAVVGSVPLLLSSQLRSLR